MQTAEQAKGDERVDAAVVLDDVEVDTEGGDEADEPSRIAWSRNLVLAFSSILLRTACESIFNKEMMSVYIYLLTESNMAVGGIAGARGIIQLLT